MKKQKLKKWLYMAGLLCMAVSCKEDDPCPKGTCCGSESQKYVFIRSVSNVKAALGQNAYFVIENDNIGGGTGGVLICPFQEPEFADYENSAPVGGKTVYIYRISGRIYNCNGCPTLMAGPAPRIFIDKIEKMN